MDRDSARLGLVNEVAVGIAGANHRDMCKFVDFQSQKYRLVWNAIEELAKISTGAVKNCKLRFSPGVTYTKSK